MLELWAEHKGNQDFLIKRVVGLAGDTLSIYWVMLEYLEGKVEDRVFQFFISSFSKTNPVPYLINWSICSHDGYVVPNGEPTIVLVPLGHVFVKGDGVTSASDSITKGPVPYSKIKGVMLIKLSSCNFSL